MSSAAELAAAAVHSILPTGPVFPTTGYLVGLTVQRGPDGLVNGVSGLAVTIGGKRYEGQKVCAAGSFLAELQVFGADGFLNREVKVGSVGGRLLVETTMNGSV